MKSPFPGLDPYLEERWGDVHQSLVTYAADQLGASLPDDLRARMEERISLIFKTMIFDLSGAFRRATKSVPLCPNLSKPMGSRSLSRWCFSWKTNPLPR